MVTTNGGRNIAWSDHSDSPERAQPTVKITAGQPVAPSGTGSARASVWTTPPRSVARVCTVWLPGASSNWADHIRQVSADTSVDSWAGCHGPPSIRTSTRSMPVCWAQAIPATVTRPAGTDANPRGKSIRDWVLIGARSATPMWLASETG